MPEQLKIVIDAEVDKAITNIKKFEKSVSGLATGSIVQLQKAALLLRTQLANLSPTALKSDFGKELSAALSTVNKQLKTLQTESGVAGTATNNAFSKAFQGVKQLANILPGLGIAGLFGVVISAVTTLAESFVSTANKAGLLRDATKEAIGGSAAEIFKINAAVSVIKDLNSSIDAQKNAREFLNKATGISVDLLSKEKIGSEETTAAIKKATEAIFQKALAEAFAAKSAAKQVELFEKQQKLNAALKSAPTTALGVLLNPTGLASAGTAAGILANNIKDIKTELDAIRSFGEDAFAKAFDFTKPVKEGGAKLKTTTDDILARARLFVKEFGDAFVLPNLDETFFRGVKELLPEAKKLLEQVKTGDLQIKIPVQTDFELLPDPSPLTKEQLDELTKNFFNDIKGVPVDIVIDPTLSVNNTKLLDEKLKLKDQFEKAFGDLGVKAFNNLNFDNLIQGIDKAKEKFADMKETIDTITNSVANGLANTFDNVFDAILEGKSVFKALGEGVKALVVDTIKAIAKMIILKIVIKALKGASGGSATDIIAGAVGGSANNFNLGGAIGGRSFQNTLQVVVKGSISGQTILLAGQRAAISTQRGG